MSRQVIVRLLRALRPVAAPMALSMVARTIQILLDVAMVAGGAWVVAQVASGGQMRLGVAVGVLAAMGLVKAVARYAEQYLGHYVAFGLLASMRTDFFDSVAPLVPAGLGDARSGDLVQRVMSDVDRVEVFYAHTSAPVASALVVPPVVAIGVGVIAHPQLGWLLAALFGVAGLGVPLVAGVRSRRAADHAVRTGGSLGSHLTEGTYGLWDVNTFAYGPRRLDELENLDGEVRSAEVGMARMEGLRSAGFDLVAGAALVGIVALGVELVATGVVEPAVLAGVVAASLVAFAPLRDVQAVGPAFQRAMSAAQRVFEVADRQPVVTSGPGSLGPPQDGELAFRSVSFAYPGRDPVLEEIDLELQPGRWVALVGPSGSGKSTIGSLAVRFWDPDSGVVTLGGIPVADLPLDRLRERVTLVQQHPRLLFGTIEDNLLLGRDGVDHARLEEALEVADLTGLVDSLPDGVQSGVGELGGFLSGGERQRVALARALVGDPSVLVVDEATSDLDVDTEASVIAKLREVSAGRAVLAIAHRLATVVDADEILVVDRGRVVERGTHRELLGSGRLYSRLWERQRDMLD